MNVRVRRAERHDASALMELIGALADYEKLDRPSTEACERLIRDGWPETGTPRFDAWLAEKFDPQHGGQIAAGYAITFFTYSSFLARPTLYIEDLFVLPGERRNGVGSALFRAIEGEARTHSCGRIEWVVLDWNTSAQEFYKRLGAAHLQEWHYYRLSL